MRGKAESAAFASLPRTGSALIVGHYFLTGAGYFGALSTLVLVLNAESFSASQIALLTTAFTFANKVAKVPLAPWLDRFSPVRSVLVGCFLAALGFCCVHLAHSVVITSLALLLARVGLSINSLASKQLAALASDSGTNRARVFSMINVAMNLSSAVAAPLALLLVARGKYQLVTYCVAAIYLFAGMFTSLNFSRVAGKHPAINTQASWATYIYTFKIPGMRSFLVVNFFGWFLFGQLFTTLALYVSDTLSAPDKLGLIFAFNSILVVTLQISVTRATESLFKDNSMRAMHVSLVIFALAATATYVVPGVYGAVLFVGLFTFAEMIFVPLVDVVLLGLVSERNRAVSYSILSLSIALGESTGGGLGLVSYRWLGAHGRQQAFWLLLAILAVLFALIARGLGTRLHKMFAVVEVP